MFKYLLKNIILILVIYTSKSYSKDFEIDSSYINTHVDSLSIEPNDSIILLDSINVYPDTTRKKEVLEHEIVYEAKDTIRINRKKNTTYLYNKAKMVYGKIKLNAGKIEIDNKNKIVRAYGIPDSTGKLVQLPEFEDNGKMYYTREMVYNMETKQAIIKNLKMEEQEGYIGSRRIKKINDKVFFAKEFYFSTDENLPAWMEKPKEVDVDFFIRSNKVKVISEDRILASESFFFLSEVPTPLFIPAAFFPISNKRSSGILMPTYSDNREQGFGLVGGGYYFVINDNFDLTTNIDFYTKGSWSLRNNLNYKKRYNYSGRFNYSYEKVIRGERGFSDYSKNILYRFSWNHSQDAKYSPTMNFSASVNMTSGKYFTNSLSQIGNVNSLTASTNSSINLSKTFEDSPFSSSMGIRHTQNLQTGKVSMSLPDLNVSMNRIFPFSKDGQKKTWYQKIGISLNSSLRNDLDTYDSLMFTPKMFDNLKTQIEHRIPISTSFKVMSYFSLSPNINYTEKWFLETVKKQYDKDKDTVIDQKVKGFDSYREFNIGASLGTTIYGMLDFGDSKLKAIRHVVKPSISYSFRPDFGKPFWGYYEEFYTDPRLGTIEEYSRFQNVSNPSRGLSSSIGLSISNTFEGKIRKNEEDYKEEKDKYKKISFIDQLSFSTSYNMAAKEYKWSNLSVNLGFKLIKDRIRINIRNNYDFYALDEEKQRINEYSWDKNKRLLRYLGTSANANFSISNKDFIFKDKEDKEDKDKKGEKEKGKNKKYDKSGYLIFEMPWSLNFGYNLNYDNSRGQKLFSSNTITIGGNVSPTKNWKIGMNTGYDFKTNEIAYTTFNFSRDLNTVFMTFNWVPMGSYRNYSFFIGIKANVLKDLKYDKKEFQPEQRI